MRIRRILVAGIIAVLTPLPWGCRRSSTGPTTPSGLGVAFSPGSASPDADVGFTITITANSAAIKSFGAQLSYDTAVLQFEDIARGSLTGDWSTLDAGESDHGAVILGGFAGSGTAVAANSSGTLAVLRFKVTGASAANGRQVSVCLGALADDLSQFSSDDACATFTLKK